MTPQQDVAGMLLWLLAAATLLFWVAVLAAKWVRVSRRLDTDLPKLLDEKRCQIGKCGLPAVAIYDRHPAGSIHVCAGHNEMVRGWVGPPVHEWQRYANYRLCLICGAKEQVPFDVDLEGDFAEWETES